MKKEFPRIPPTFDNLYEYFISRSRKNLHVVLCFSPVRQRFVCLFHKSSDSDVGTLYCLFTCIVYNITLKTHKDIFVWVCGEAHFVSQPWQVGPKFRSRSLKFPGLISGCTMDWFTPWPNEALVAVSNYFLSEFNMVCSAEVKASVVTAMGTYHDKVSVTCESYFER